MYGDAYPLGPETDLWRLFAKNLPTRTYERDQMIYWQEEQADCFYCIKKGIAIEEMSMDEFKSFSPKFEEDIYDKISVRSCIKAKKSKGSTSFASVMEQIKDIESN